jgi:hypothetical protein
LTYCALTKSPSRIEYQPSALDEIEYTSCKTTHHIYTLLRGSSPIDTHKPGSIFVLWRNLAGGTVVNPQRKLFESLGLRIAFPLSVEVVSMDATTVIILVLGVVIIAAIAVAVWFYLQKQRTSHLRAKFGPEYSRAVRAEGDTKHAEQVLEQRQQRVNKLNITALSAGQRNEFAQAWEKEQARFVDDPSNAVNNADRLVRRVMETRGYPVSDFEQRVADISVDHPVVVENYRVAHAVAARTRDQQVSTEELRTAMIHYRALFADLLKDGRGRPVSDVMRADNTRARSAGR